MTPSKLKTMPLEEACKISRDFAITAIQALDAFREKQDKPLRFIYMSGHFTPRGLAELPKEIKDPSFIEYALARVRIDERASALALSP